jgi:hypothetical protein
MKQQAEFTVTPRELPARSFLKRIQDIHDAIARRVQGLFLPGGFGRGQDRTGWFLAKSESLGQVPVEISDRPWKLNG